MKRASIGYQMWVVVFVAIDLACVKSIIETAWPYRELLMGLWRGVR